MYECLCTKVYIEKKHEDYIHHGTHKLGSQESEGKQIEKVYPLSNVGGKLKEMVSQKPENKIIQE